MSNITFVPKVNTKQFSDNRKTERGSTMKRYEVKQISENWFGIYDIARREYIIESTSFGIKVYAEMLNC